MKEGEVIHLGDGAYLKFDGYGFEVMANHHEHPSDRVYLEPFAAKELVNAITGTLKGA